MKRDSIHQGFPRQVLEAALASEINQFTSAKIPCFGLPAEWPGTRCLGESEERHASETDLRSGEAVTEESAWTVLQLAHGDFSKAGTPYAVIETREGDDGPALDERMLEHFLRVNPQQRLEPFSWIVTIDELDLKFRGVRSGSSIIGRHRTSNLLITLGSRDWNNGQAPDALTRVHDFGPYIDGRRRQLLGR